MALTPSNMMPLGTIAPDFNLIDVVSNEMKSLSQLKGSKGTLVMFICNHCPYVIHIEQALKRMGDQYHESEIGIIAISANSPISHPQDSPEEMAKKSKNLGFTFPYLFDETQQIAKAYQAACTPDFFLFDKNLACAYRGQFDDSRPGNNLPVTGTDLIDAIENLVHDRPINTNQKASIGCNIKWAG
ncbi:MAG: thioredoxin family protein [Kangiellaceae bacterium]|nr:thioredoxin family protein [Kangiellaceae bacterium]MCW8999226.1 thioredoxin family protein [Kangiellaceae bacterium]MCW9015846.1 thioredoxin family protein [Kangiellaceae bacterium]